MSIRRFTLSGLAALGLCAALPAVATAAASPAYTPAGTFGGLQEAFSVPLGVGVNQASHDVYVDDQGASKVDQFNAAGEWQSQTAIAGAGTLYQLAVDNSGGATQGEVYVVDYGRGVVYKLDPNPSGELAPDPTHPVLGAGTLSEPTGIAVDASGDVYVANLASGTVSKLSPSGAVLNAELITGLSGPFALAVDSAGNIYVAGAAGTVEYDAAGSCGACTPIEEQSARGVAVDHESNVFVSNEATHTVQEYSAAVGHPQITNPALEEVEGHAPFSFPFGLSVAEDLTQTLYVADDEGVVVDIFARNPIEPTTAGASEVKQTTATLHGELTSYASEAHYYFEYGTTTGYGSESPAAPGTAVAFPSPPGQAPAVTSLSGLEPNTTYHYRLVASAPGGNPARGKDQTFTTSRLELPPSIGSLSAASVAATSAELDAQIDPNLFDTHYYFQYITDSQFKASGFAGASSAPPGEGDLGDAGTEQTASVHIQNLQPGTSYDYRVVAQNGNGSPQTSAAKLITTQTVGEPFQLPDNRAYEMVSPVDKNGGDVSAPPPHQLGLNSQASPGGGKILYRSTVAFGDAQSAPIASSYIATRGEDGWTTHSLAAPEQSSNGGALLPTFWLGFTPDLSTGFLSEPNVISETAAEPNQTNLYVGDGSGSWQVLTQAAAGPEESLPEDRLGGFTPDGSHVLFEFTGKLTPNATAGEQNLYESSGGHYTLINVLPDGAIDHLPNDSVDEPGGKGGFGAGVGPTVGTISGPFSGTAQTDISSDGSRVFWSDCNPRCADRPGPGEGNKLFVSISGRPSVQLDASQGGPDSGDGLFRLASTDGSQAFFTDAGRLTEDSTACGNAGQCSDLYRFDTNTDRLTDMTVDTRDALGAQVEGVLGASSDGSIVYFVARGVLSTSPNSHGQSAAADAPNLYVSEPDAAHPGQSKTTFIATLAPLPGNGFEYGTAGEAVGGDNTDFHLEAPLRTASVTSDGEHVAFQSVNSLTGYDNAIAGGDSCGEYVVSVEPVRLGPACTEVFEYSAAANELVCASCDPTGARPTGPSVLPTASTELDQPRYLSEDGSRLFFDSFDALVSQDSNAKQDVYEYEAGRARLISSGSGSTDSQFIDASTSGDDVFFTTRDPLVAQDQDQSVDLYDARVGGGSQAISSPVCSGAGCQGVPPAPPIFAAPASTTFNGVGNFPAPTQPTPVKAKSKVKAKQCKKGFIKKKNKCIRRPKKKSTHRKGSH